MDFAVLATVTQLWLAAILMVFMYTFLFKETHLYRIAEHVFIGASAANVFVMGLGFIYAGSISRIARGNLAYVIPLVLGLLMFTTFSKKSYWLSRYAVAIMVGVGTGLTLRATPSAQILGQIIPTLSIIGRDLYATLNNILILVAAVTAVSYFIFTREHKGPLGVSTKLGRYFMLVAFGASYGGTVMTRLAVFVPQMQYLLSSDAMGGTILATSIAVAVLGYSLTKRKRG